MPSFECVDAIAEWRAMRHALQRGGRVAGRRAWFGGGGTVVMLRRHQFQVKASW